MAPHVLTRLLRIAAVVFLLAPPETVSAGDWPDWRGPGRDGISAEKGLPTEWSLSGQGMAWKAPYGGRSAPIVLGERLYLQNTAGNGATEQERILCFDAALKRIQAKYVVTISRDWRRC